ncbi:MAG: hypothetical protein WD066_09785 [Planctomycetaceae bacterium]
MFERIALFAMIVLGVAVQYALLFALTYFIHRYPEVSVRIRSLGLCRYVPEPKDRDARVADLRLSQQMMRAFGALGVVFVFMMLLLGGIITGNLREAWLARLVLMPAWAAGCVVTIDRATALAIRREQSGKAT